MMMMFCFNDVKLKSIGGRGLQKYDQWQIKLASNYFSDIFFKFQTIWYFKVPTYDTLVAMVTSTGTYITSGLFAVVTKT